MKKVFIMLLGIILFMVGCSDAEGSNNAESQNNNDNNANEENNAEDNQSENDEEEQILEKVGQKIKDPQLNGEVELMAIKEIDQTIDLDPVKITIDSVKIIRMHDIKNKDFLSSINHITNKSSFDYVQIMYDIENTEERNVVLNSPIAAVVLNTGEQIDTFENDIAYDPNIGKTLRGKVHNSSLVSLIIGDSKLDGVDEIKIVAGSILDAESYETIAGEKEIDVQIK